MSRFLRVVLPAVLIQALLFSVAISPTVARAATGSAAPAADEAWLAGAQRHVIGREYRASANSEGLQAPNRRHALRT
ncbi:MAG: hypothetical protein ACYSUN_17235, partial [Planctomycetota bacterium]